MNSLPHQFATLKKKHLPTEPDEYEFPHEMIKLKKEVNIAAKRETKNYLDEFTLKSAELAEFQQKFREENKQGIQVDLQDVLHRNVIS